MYLKPIILYTHIYNIIFIVKFIYYKLYLYLLYIIFNDIYITFNWFYWSGVLYFYGYCSTYIGEVKMCSSSENETIFITINGWWRTECKSYFILFETSVVRIHYYMVAVRWWLHTFQTVPDTFRFFSRVYVFFCF